MQNINGNYGHGPELNPVRGYFPASHSTKYET